MSEESLRRFLERLNGDAAFVERLKANPSEVLAGFELSPTERIALGTNDADGLRRLAGQDVTGFVNLGASRGIGAGAPHLGCVGPIQTAYVFCSYPIPPGSSTVNVACLATCTVTDP
jgi:hypothetical protein